MDRIVKIIIEQIADVILTAFANTLVKKVREHEYLFADELIDVIDEVLQNGDWVEDVE